jgi:acetylornithine deacetylase/succinyl-diaminopimelate desuccinylase-like protein
MECKADILKNYCEKVFEDSAIPSLVEYIKIPNLSRAFDPLWETNGLLDKAAEHIKTWVEALNIKGLKTEIIKEKGLSPIIYTEIAGDLDVTVFYYGHFDKQPPFNGWDEDLGPTKPVIKKDKLYGRGGADDGYSTYSTMISIKACQEAGLKIPRCVMIT